jgi:hypothetical protein
LSHHRHQTGLLTERGSVSRSTDTVSTCSDSIRLRFASSRPLRVTDPRSGGSNELSRLEKRLKKRLVNLWSRKKITIKAHAGREQAIKWQISSELNKRLAVVY